MAPKTNSLTLSDAQMLHPQSCGSSIRFNCTAYQQGKARSFDARVMLSDCDRQIAWTGYGDEGASDMDAKLKAAIAALQQARRQIRIVARHYETLFDGDEEESE